MPLQTVFEHRPGQADFGVDREQCIANGGAVGILSVAIDRTSWPIVHATVESGSLRKTSPGHIVPIVRMHGVLCVLRRGSRPA